MAQFKVVVTDPTPKGIKRLGQLSESNKYSVDVDAVDKYVGIKLEGCLTGEEDDQVILIEHYNGEWVVRVWSDCNSADPTHRIVLKKAPTAD
tara:strand:+ start:178 stop:453 length:276 start_codon:yes stop_codon:yes gene_type:complete